MPDSARILRSNSHVESARGGVTANMRHSQVRTPPGSPPAQPRTSQNLHLSQPPLLPARPGAESSPRQRVESGWPPPGGMGRGLVSGPRTPSLVSSRALPALARASLGRVSLLLKRELPKPVSLERLPQLSGLPRPHALALSGPNQLTVPEMPPATKLMPTDGWSFGLSPLNQLFTNS